VTAYYNEFDPFAAQWLRNLIDAGLIPAGDVDERSILDVRPADLGGYTQCHFFAGIGGWPLALRLAGWPDDRPVWTGSCPCQPLSSAGKRKGHADERHLWPAFYSLIAERQPPAVFGEQVASKDGREWFAAVRADLEGLGYAVGGADLCAAGIGAPHIRQRLFWGADAHQQQRHRFRNVGAGRRSEPAIGGSTDRLEHTDGSGRDAGQPAAPADGHGGSAGSDGGALGLGDPLGAGLEIQHRQPGDDGSQQPTAERAGQAVGGVANAPGGEQRGLRECGSGNGRLEQPHRGHGSVGGLVGEINIGWPGAHHGGWADADWLFCTDGRWRPVEPGTQPLAHGVPGRVGLLRGYGNAINPELGAEFVAAFLEAKAGLSLSRSAFLTSPAAAPAQAAE
jgi:DNA (cytosine-5)-methyltransferase 1